jgi:hypothetical protein
VPEESFELDFASSWGVAAFALQKPYQNNELARLRDITVFLCIKENEVGTC